MTFRLRIGARTVFALLAGCFYGAFLTASRWLSGVARPRGLLFSQLLIGALVLAPVGLAHLPAASAPVAGLALLSALASMAGNLREAVLADRRTEMLSFGDEGQGWQLMRPRDFLSNPLAIPHFRHR